ncbi:MAG: BPSS1780 family membrane protein [Burkholderiaceae bacterium]|nr:BPSS1780 family membrane protein [Burkholderiaceae bacterium]
MKLLTVPASRGVLWVRSGFRVFFRKPLAFAALFASFLFGAMLVLLVPGIGSLLLLTSLPLVSQGFMLATQHALAGQTPMAHVFIEAVRGRRPQAIAMLKIGLIYAAGSLFIMWFSNVVDGGTFDALQEAMTTKTADTERLDALLSDPRLTAGMLVRLGLASLLALPFWHAPALVHWDGQGPAQSLFSSTIACWRNKGAFAVYGLTWGAVVLLFAVLVNTVFMLLGAPQLVAVAALPAGLMFSTVFYASLYFTFTDCFEQRAPADSPADAMPLP